MKKLVVINFSGNVGKTVVAAHLLLPRIPLARLYSVESVNVDASDEGVEVERVRGSRYLQLSEDLLQAEAAVVDVGASNVEGFLAGMKALEGSHAEFDAFVVPVTRGKKQLTDAINTVAALASLGVEAARIRVLFNKVDPNDDLADEFGPFLEFCADSDACVVNPDACIYLNDVFERLRGLGLSLAAARSDREIWRERVREARDDAERRYAIARLTVQRLATSAGRNLDMAWEALQS